MKISTTKVEFDERGIVPTVFVMGERQSSACMSWGVQGLQRFLKEGSSVVAGVLRQRSCWCWIRPGVSSIAICNLERTLHTKQNSVEVSPSVCPLIQASKKWRPLRDSNPCRRRERAVS
jgi:hypothetical protein